MIRTVAPLQPYALQPGQQVTGQLDNVLDLGLIDAGRVIRLPEGEFLFSEVVERLDLNMGERFSIIGAGSHKTKIKTTSDVSGYFMTLRSANLNGPETVTWPNGDGTSFFDNAPTTKLAANVEPGLWTLDVVSTTGIEVGALVAIKSQRLFVNTDNRNSCMFGELNRVKEVASSTQLVLEQVTEFGYRNSDLVYTGTAASGTDSTIVLAGGHGLNLDQVNGCRITITGGTGAGQVRYCSFVDADTGTLTIDTVSSRAQSPFSPAPDNTSVFTLDAPTYVDVFNNPFSCVFEGFTLDTYASETNGLSIGEAYRPMLRDVWIKGSISTALRMRQCYQPRLEYFYSRDITSETLGYGTVLSSCRDAYDFARITNGCRRGIDVTGDYPSINCTIDGAVVSQGGGATFIGGTTGVGSHGGSHRTTYKNIHFTGGDGSQAILIRGSQETIDGLHVDGPIRLAVALSYGNGTTINNVTWNGMTLPTNYPTVPAVPVDTRLVSVAPTYSGGIYINGVNADAAMNTLVFFGQDFALADNKRVKGDLVVQNVQVRNPITGIFTLIDADGDYIPEPGTWFVDFDSIHVNMTGGGTYRQFANWKLGQGGPPTTGTVIRVGDRKWIATLKDGELFTIPFYNVFSMLEVKLCDRIYSGSTPVYFFGVIRDGSTSAAVAWSTASAQMEVLDGPFVIGDVTANKFAIGYDGVNLYLGNEVGRTVTIAIEL